MRNCPAARNKESESIVLNSLKKTLKRLLGLKSGAVVVIAASNEKASAKGKEKNKRSRRSGTAPAAEGRAKEKARSERVEKFRNSEEPREKSGKSRNRGRKHAERREPQYESPDAPPAPVPEHPAALDEVERTMDYSYIPGVRDFIADLKAHGVPMAVVTSSNELKMEAVYHSHPEVRTLFGPVLTADMFTASKPDPQCFLLGMKTCGSTPESTFVFEDSVNGLKAGMASGATVVGLTTTNPRKTVEPLCHYVIEDFRGFTLEKMLEIRKSS